MMTLVTGTPGAGKTLNTIKMVHEEILKTPFFDKKGDDGIIEKYQREVYACNINGIDTEKSGFKILEDPRKWTSLPAGSILIIDEASDFYPTSKKFGEELESDIAELRKHRHYGIDIYYITQQPGLINKNIRILCGEHIHYQRPRNSKITIRYSNSSVFETDSKFLRFAEQNGALKEKVVLDKKYFDFYKSTEVDTHKSKIPIKAIFFKLGLPIVLFLVCVYFLYTFFTDSKENVDNPVSPPQTQEQSKSVLDFPQNSLSGNTFNSKKLTKEQYQEELKPRIPFVQETAPIYDGVYQVNSYPRIIGCLKTGVEDSNCECYTQQFTVYKLPVPVCLDYLEGNRRFDYAIPDKI
ncbi:zonular occludens toxin domain-containing protein [Vibrio campbellii]